MANRLTTNIRKTVKQSNSMQAVVVDASGGRASVKISGNGARYSNLEVVGGTVKVGEWVTVDFSTSIPKVLSSNPVVTTSGKGTGKNISRASIGYQQSSGGHGILLQHGSSITVYAMTNEGLAGAVGSASSGDLITVPMCADGEYTADIELEGGVVLSGTSRTAVIISGKVTLGAGSGIENVSIIRATGSGEVIGVDGPTTGVGQVVNCTIRCTSYGSGLAMGVRANGGGTTEVWASSLEGVSGGGSGYGGGVDATGVLVHYGGRSIGSTTPYLE